MIEDDIRLVLDKYNSSFITDELKPGLYTFNGLSQSVFNYLQPEYGASSDVIVIEFDDVTMKTDLVVRPGIIAIKFDETSFFTTILGFFPHWDYKHYNQYISQKIVKLSSTIKIHLKCDVINGSVVNGLGQPILYSFVLDKPAGYRDFSQLETVQF